MTDIDTAGVMAAHATHQALRSGIVTSCVETARTERREDEEACLPYRLAEALAAMTKDRDSADAHADDWERNAEQAREALATEQAKVGRVEALEAEWNHADECDAGTGSSTTHCACGLTDLRAALADQPEPGVASPRA